MEKGKSFFISKYGSANNAFELKKTPIPNKTTGFTRIKVEGFGINFADIMSRKGLYEDAPKLPAVVGYEVVGMTMDEGILPKNTRVVAFTRFGGYSTHVLADNRVVLPIPKNIPIGEALALAVQYSTAYHCAIDRVSVFPEDHVLVQAAAGGVGTALVQLLKTTGCTIYGTAGSKEKLAYLKAQGVHHAINYRTQNFKTVIKETLGNRGLDIVFDSLGGKSFSDGFSCLGKGGRIVGFGASEQVSGGIKIINQLKLVENFGIYSPIQLLMNSKSMIGVNMLHIADSHPHVIAGTMKKVLRLWENKTIKPIVGKIFNYKQLAEAHTFVEQRKSVGKVAVIW